MAPDCGGGDGVGDVLEFQNKIAAMTRLTPGA
jgi:hypothetical protein